MGQRRLRLALTDNNPPTESRQQHYEPNHGRSPKSPENRSNIIENRPKIVAKSFSDDQGGHNHPWTAFGTMLRTPKARPGRSKSALGTPRACQKGLGNASGRAKDVQKSAWRAPETHLEPICLVERRPRSSWIDFRTFSQ